jgi:hypothetical protein
MIRGKARITAELSHKHPYERFCGDPGLPLVLAGAALVILIALNIIFW